MKKHTKLHGLKNGAFELITAVGLMALVCIYLELRHESLLIDPGLVRGELIVLYVVIAVASEVAITAAFKPLKTQIFWANLVVGGIIMLPAWGHNHYLRDFLYIGTATALLRMLTALISLRVPSARARRFASALLGGPLLVESVWRGVNLGEQTYYTYYFFPKFKEGYIVPTRWQDCVAFIVLWCGISLLLYVSYRLLRNAFGGRIPPPMRL